MPRRSSGGRSARPRPAPRPAACSPPPQKEKNAPPPAPVQSNSGGGILRSIGSTIMEGMAFGAGSSVGHRAVDAVMGPRTIVSEAAAAPTPAPAPAASSMGGSDACNTHSKAFQDCLNSYGNDISKCQFYMDMLAECRRNSGSAMSY